MRIKRVSIKNPHPLYPYQQVLNGVFADICSQRREKRLPLPEKHLTGTEFYEVTYRDDHRKWVTGYMELQIADRGNRVYEALYMLRRMGIEATRVRVSAEAGL